RYGAADVFVQLSREETFGKVTAEALACGTPAIVYNATANPELIGENCGYVVEPGDFVGLMSCVTRIREKGKVDYSASCREFARQNFDRDNRIDDHVELYRQVMGLKQGLLT
ncbi:glycosyltransferase, partial [bacterium]|nr:glycosyltransferase [bacterium]